MQRKGSTWAYFISLILGVAMTVALLPACGGGGGGSSCNSPDNQVEGQEAACDAEEVVEEDIQASLEDFLQLREETGQPDLDGEGVEEFIDCGVGLGCNELL